MVRLVLLTILVAGFSSACRPADRPTTTSAPAATPSPGPATPATAVAAPCPVGGTSIALPADSPSSQAWLVYFNNGGSPDALEPIAPSRHAEGLTRPSLLTLDLTGDGLLDLLIATPHGMAPDEAATAQQDGRLDVLICRDGRYQLAWSEASSAESAVPLPRLVTDVNLDRRQDVVLSRYSCGAHTCFEDLAALTWDGAHLADRWRGSSADLPYPEVQLLEEAGGPPAIQVTGTGVGSVGAGPYRPVRRTWRWDEASGTMRVESEVHLPSNYRIHVLHDAVLADSQGRWEEAADLYRRVVIDSSLQDWQDPEAEQATLSEYATFRRMRLFAMQGDLEQAHAEYDALLPRSTAEAEVSPFAMMGQAFWKSYEQQRDVSVACEAARLAAASSGADVPRLLEFGYANPAPTLEELCPAEGG